MRIDIALIISLSIGAVLFSYFYSAPAIVGILTAEDILGFIPDAYAYKSDMPSKLVFETDYFDGYRVITYWYYWPYDGTKKVDDWEPVVVYTKDGDVVAVATRVHYVWRVDYNPPLNGTHPVVTFGYLYHTPLLQEPVSGWEKVNLPLSYEAPPEDIDPKSIVSLTPDPTQSALYAAIMYSSMWSIIIYATVAGILRENRFVEFRLKN